MNNPYQIEGCWTPNVGIDDINKLREQNDNNCPNIYIKDHIKFFQYLTEITNNLVTLYNKYGEHKSARALLILVMRRIWLRMGVNDFNNVETFLKRQLEFIDNELFNDYSYDGINIDKFYDYDVKAQNRIGRTWDEATKCVKFSINDGDNYHSLPHIFYGVEDNTCYIYAVQNDFDRKRVPKIERLLYKLNKNVENPNVHPSMVYSMKLFINFLKENGICTIKVPTLQVLSYRYHELLSIQAKEEFLKRWDNEAFERLKYLKGDSLKWRLEEYDNDKKWYDHVVDKEDIISRLKTENLLNLVNRIVIEDDELELINDIDMDDTLTIKIKKSKVKELQSTKKVLG